MLKNEKSIKVSNLRKNGPLIKIRYVIFFVI